MSTIAIAALAVASILLVVLLVRRAAQRGLWGWLFPPWHMLTIALLALIGGCSSGSNDCALTNAQALGEFDAGFAAGFQAGESDDAPPDAGVGDGGPCPPAPMNRGPSTRDAAGVCVFGQCIPQWGDCDGNVYGDCSTDLAQDPNCGACKTDCLSVGKKCAAVAPDIFGCI